MDVSGFRLAMTFARHAKNKSVHTQAGEGLLKLLLPLPSMITQKTPMERPFMSMKILDFRQCTRDRV